MKINKILTISLAAGALAACNSGTSLQAQQLDATHTALSASASADSVKAYVAQLAAAQTNGNNPRVEQLRQQLIGYYSKAPIVQTVQGNGYTIDCIPFLQQPALINASASDKATAIRHNQQHLADIAKAGNSLNNMASEFDFKMTMCPESTVAITRVNPEHLSSLVSHSRLSVNGGFGYSWIQLNAKESIDSNINAGSYTSFVSPNPKKSNNYVASSTAGDHSLNQLWWTSPKGDSLETGWISSSYFTDTPQTTLFAFSTNDGWERDKDDEYNTQGPFVQYTSTPVTLGTPLTTSQEFTLSYVKLNDGQGFELRYKESGNTQAIGYYPMSHFLDVSPDFNTFSSGSETDENGFDAVTMGGSITALGVVDESNNILTNNSLLNDDLSVRGIYNYKYKFNADGSITFSGTHIAPSPSPQPTSLPSGAPLGQYTQGATTINWDGSHLSAVYNGVTTPVLNYGDACSSGSQVNNNGILYCPSSSSALSDITGSETFAHGYWPSSCYVQDVTIDNSISGCANATPQTAAGICVSQIDAYCTNSNNALVKTSFNPNSNGCYDAQKEIWNIALNSDGQLYCPTTAKF